MFDCQFAPNRPYAKMLPNLLPDFCLSRWSGKCNIVARFKHKPHTRERWMLTCKDAVKRLGYTLHHNLYETIRDDSAHDCRSHCWFNSENKLDKIRRTSQSSLLKLIFDDWPFRETQPLLTRFKIKSR